MDTKQLVFWRLSFGWSFIGCLFSLKLEVLHISAVFDGLSHRLRVTFFFAALEEWLGALDGGFEVWQVKSVVGAVEQWSTPNFHRFFSSFCNLQKTQQIQLQGWRVASFAWPMWWRSACLGAWKNSRPNRNGEGWVPCFWGDMLRAWSSCVVSFVGGVTTLCRICHFEIRYCLFVFLLGCFGRFFMFYTPQSLRRCP